LRHKTLFRNVLIRNLKKAGSFSLMRHLLRFSNTTRRQPKRNTGMTGSAGKKKPKTAMIQNAICGSCEAEENIPYTHIISDGLDAVRTYFRFSKVLPEM
jgi:hypothetical protein